MPMPKQAILIVERETTWRQRLKALRRLYVHTVVEAVEPTEAFRTFQRLSPALIILNASLQIADDGLILAQRIRHLGNLVPLILLRTLPIWWSTGASPVTTTVTRRCDSTVRS